MAIDDYGITDEKDKVSMLIMDCPSDYNRAFLPTIDWESFDRAVAAGNENEQIGPIFLVTRAEVRKFGTTATITTRDQVPKALPPTRRVDSQTPRFLPLIPMPCLDTNTQATLPTYCCRSCMTAPHDCWEYCQLALPNGVDIPHVAGASGSSVGVLSCKGVIAKGRLYTTGEMLAHFTECEGAQMLLGEYVRELLRAPISERALRKRRERKGARGYYGV